MESTRPRDVGIDPDRLEHFFAVVERLIERKWLRGGSFLIARRGKIAAARALGFVDTEGRRRAKPDDIYCIFSTSKPITSTLLLMRVDRGDLRLIDRVADYIPEFGAAGKTGVTITHLLTHMGGFPNLPPDWPVQQWGDWDGTIARICALPLEFEPGTALHYHALTAHWIMAEIVRRLDGAKRCFAEICADEVYRPLKMKDSHMGVRPDMRERLVALKALDAESIPFPFSMLEDFDLPEAQAAAIPGGGSRSTIFDLARFYQMWLNGGELDGLRLLSPAMVQLATTIHTGEHEDRLLELLRVMNGWPRIPANRGLGWWVRGTGIFPSFFGSLASSGTFGHAGASSIMAWADPARELVFVGLTAGLIAEARNIVRWHQLSDLAQSCVVD
jgi:CubicO group peptidase (beta-lactamase class C family)